MYSPVMNKYFISNKQPVTEGKGIFATLMTSLAAAGWTLFMVGSGITVLFTVGVVITWGAMFAYIIEHGLTDKVVEQMCQNKKFVKYITTEGKKEYNNLKKQYKRLSFEMPGHFAFSSHGNYQYYRYIDLDEKGVEFDLSYFSLHHHFVLEKMHFLIIGDTDHVEAVKVVIYCQDKDCLLLKEIKEPSKGEIEGFFKEYQG